MSELATEMLPSHEEERPQLISPGVIRLSHIRLGYDNPSLQTKLEAAIRHLGKKYIGHNAFPMTPKGEYE